MLSGFVPTIDWRVLTFTGALSLASGLIFGMFPALQTATSDLNNVLKEGGRGSMIGARAQRTQSFLVIVEIAFATVLLISAGLLIRSFVHLINVKTGVNPGECSNGGVVALLQRTSLRPRAARVL